MAYERSKDVYPDTLKDPTAPCRNLALAAKSDTADFDVYPKAFFIAVAGNLSFIPLVQDGDTPIILPVQVGWFLVRCRRILNTNTTATVYAGY